VQFQYGIYHLTHYTRDANVLDLYLVGYHFEPRPEHRLSRGMSPSLRGTTMLVPLLLPKYRVVHYSSLVLQLWAVESGSADHSARVV
jgi:hypothetical protein